MLTIVSRDGNELTPEVAFAQKTYLSIVEGFPDNDENRRIIEEEIPAICMNELRHSHYFLIDPVATKKERRILTERGPAIVQWMEYPPVIVSVAFRCSATVKSESRWIFCGMQALKICFRDQLESRIPGQVPFSQPRADVARIR